MNNFNLEDYDLVQDRIKKFYEKHPKGRIITQLTNHTADFKKVIFCAMVYLDEGNIAKATGWAEETQGQGGFANKGSHIENCETSAIGRALANMGMHGDKRPSKEEMSKCDGCSKSKQNKVLSKEEALKFFDGLPKEVQDFFNKKSYKESDKFDVCAKNEWDSKAVVEHIKHKE